MTLMVGGGGLAGVEESWFLWGLTILKVLSERRDYVFGGVGYLVMVERLFVANECAVVVAFDGWQRENMPLSLARASCCGG